MEWGLIQDVPAAFADGKDNAGVTKLRLKVVTACKDIPVRTTTSTIAYCPDSYELVGGGISQDNYDVTIALYERELAVKWVMNPRVRPDRFKVLGSDRRFEQRSSLYGLLVWKDKVRWEAVPVAQFDKRVVTRPGRWWGLPAQRVRAW